jgi:hypothetical protein
LHNFQINCTCNIIEQVNQYIYLGVIIDEDFEWKVHVKVVCNKLRSALTQIVKIKAVLNEKTIKNIYFSIVYP